MDNNTQQVRYFDVYCKIPFTEVTGTFRLQSNMTITEFLECANKDIRNNLNIHSYYSIEVVQTGKLGEELERYGYIYNAGNLVAFYIRPVNPVTREFIRRVDYSVA
jgi:hypothetical protein